MKLIYIGLSLYYVPVFDLIIGLLFYLTLVVVPPKFWCAGYPFSVGVNGSAKFCTEVYPDQGSSGSTLYYTSRGRAKKEGPDSSSHIVRSLFKVIAQLGSDEQRLFVY